jgi:HAD superfamily hydrolase (TIGR01549 family)
MKYEAISFDAAGTLIDVKWNPVETVLVAANRAGIQIEDIQVAGETYGRMLQTRWAHFQALNLQRSREVCDDFWKQLGSDWMTRLNLPQEQLPALVNAADDYIFGANSTVFSLFPDTLEILEKIKSKKIPIILLSNWDVSLHRTCDFLQITPYFQKIIASLEEGVEKPDPRLFQVAKDFLQTSNVLHIGDDPLADVHGARSFGWDALLLDRESTPTTGRISSLSQILDYL